MTVATSNTSKTRAAVIFALKLAVVVAAVAYLFGSGRLRLDQLVLSAHGAPWLVAAAGLAILLILVGQVRFWTVLKGGGVDVGLGSVVQIGLISWSANALLIGGVGAVSSDAIRVAYLTRLHARPARLIVASLVDRAAGAFVLVVAAAVLFPMLLTRGPVSETAELLPDIYAIIAGIAIFWGSAYVGSHYGLGKSVLIWVVGSVLAAVALVAVFAPFLVPLLLLIAIGAAGFMLTFLATKADAYGDFSGRHWAIRGVAATIEAIAEYVRRPGPLLVALLLSLVIQASAITILYCAARAISVPAEPSWLQTLVAGVPAVATSLLPLPASGLGVGEAAFDIMLRTQVDAAGTPLVGGAAIFLVFRLVMLATSLIGLPILLVYRHRQTDG